MANLAQRSRAALAAGGQLSKALPGFRPRDAQLRLAEAVAETIQTRGNLLAEAGTGTGKTFAYLVPALLSGVRTIVSTGTRALQDQLYHRDLPWLRDALGIGLRSALLKGRANYLCRYRLDQARAEPRYSSREQQHLLQRMVAWSGRTRMGDLAELEGLPEDSLLIPAVTSTVDNCLGSECPFWGDCFVVQARQRAQAADLVVVNHHLLLADLALKQEGFGEILPGAELFVVDEAHQLPELAAQFFGEALSARPLVDLARDAISECRHASGALASVQAPAQALEQAIRGLRAGMTELPIRAGRERLLAEPGMDQALDGLAHALQTLADALQPLREAAPGLDACHLRARNLLGRLQRWRQLQPVAADDEAERGAEAAHPGWTEEQAPADAADEAQPTTPPAPGEQAAPDDVRWYELSPRGFRLQRTPLDVSGPLRAHREHSRAAWVFTSATLSVADSFDHYAERLGLEDPQTLLQPSPFDWPRQALCYLPPRLPQPAAIDYTDALLQAIKPVLKASGGRAFLLFASLRALREAARLLRADPDAPWPLFVQGEAPRARLLEGFLASGNGVLLGSASFREGVDVPGDALVLVVIDKLPFAAPDDPVFQARLDAVRRAGGNPFRDEQLPQAVIALKQGAGRLIRTESDRGVLVLGDPRLLEKPYGRVFLKSLPPLPMTRELDDVLAFFAAGTDAAGVETAAVAEPDGAPANHEADTPV